MNKFNNKTIILIGKIIVSLIFLYVLINNFVNIENIDDYLSSMTFIWVPLILIITFLSVIFRSLRWKYITSNFKELSFKDALVYYLISIYYGSITPGKLGEFIKAILYSKKYKVPKQKGFITALYERLFDLILPVLIIIVYLITPSYFLVLFIPIILTPFIFVFGTNVLTRITNFSFFKKFNFVKYNITKKLFYSSIMTFFEWIMFSLVTYFLLISFGYYLDPLFVIFTVSFVTLFAIVPITFNGFGLRESAYIFLYNNIVPSEIILVISLLSFVLTTFFLAIIGLVLDWTFKK